VGQDLVKERGSQVLVTIHLGAGGNDRVLGHGQTLQAAMSALRAADGGFVALAHDDHEVQVAIFGGSAPSVRTEQPNLLRLEFGHELLRRRFDERFIQGGHGWYLAWLVGSVEGGIGKSRQSLPIVGGA